MSSHAGQAAHARADRLDAESIEMAQPDLHRGNAQIVERAVFEAGFARRQSVGASLNGGEIDGAAGEPRAAEPRQASAGGSADSRRRWDSRTSCRTKARRSRAARPAGRGGWWARTPPHRAAHPNPRACASSTRSSGCLTPEKFDCAGNAKRFGRRRVALGEQRSASASDRCAVRATSAARSRRRPLAHVANSRMPLTEL